MISSIHDIRKNISETMESSFRYVDAVRTRKAINEKYYKSMLRLNQVSKQEYKDFMKSIKAKINQLVFVNINENLTKN